MARFQRSKPVDGTVIFAARVHEADAPYGQPRARGSSARARGIRYERNVARELSSRYNDGGFEVQHSTWFRFTDASGSRMCQPDTLLIEHTKLKVTIVETKLRHTADAWLQLFLLYSPVIALVYPGYKISCVEVCEFYDCATECPVEPRLVKRIHDCNPGVFGVHIYKP